MTSPTFTKTLEARGTPGKTSKGAVLNGSLPKIEQGIIGNQTLAPTNIDILDESQHREVMHRPFFYVYNKAA